MPFQKGCLPVSGRPHRLKTMPLPVVPPGFVAPVRPVPPGSATALDLLQALRDLNRDLDSMFAALVVYRCGCRDYLYTAMYEVAAAQLPVSRFKQRAQIGSHRDRVSKAMPACWLPPRNYDDALRNLNELRWSLHIKYRELVEANNRSLQRTGELLATL